MKYAFFPGCVSRGGCPELYPSAVSVCQRLGLELEVMEGASCTGAGVLQEKNQKLGDTLNARTFAMAEAMGLPIMTICSTCQGAMSQAHKRLTDDPEYMAEINIALADEGLEFKNTVVVKHLLWILVEDIGLENLKGYVTRPLSGMKVAPFYGCYIIRPTGALGFDEHPEREDSLERVIEILGADVVDFRGKTKCCGFPILTINEANSVAMVTPCPLCHLNLDGFQPAAAASKRTKIDLPILHLPQMVGLAMGMDPKSMGLNKHIISTGKLLTKVAVEA